MLEHVTQKDFLFRPTATESTYKGLYARHVATGSGPHLNAPRPKEALRVKCFEFADRQFARFLRLATAVHESFWLGCLGPDDLNIVTATHYTQSQLYSSNDHNVSGLLNWERVVLERYFRPRARILVAAAGAGRELVALRKDGFDAEGFECNPSLVRASEKILETSSECVRLICCAPDSVPQGAQMYDGLIVGWSAYTHIPTRARRVFFLQALRERALPHSPVLVSFFTRRKFSHYESFVHQASSVFQLLLRGRKEPLESGDHIEWSRYVHRFTREEMEEELTTAGFQIVHYHDDGNSGHAVGVSVVRAAGA